MRSTKSWLFKRVACWSLTGGVLGAAISVIVNNALIEISLTPFFAALFGCVLLLLGSLMIWRKLWEQHEAFSTRVLVLGFSCLVMVAGNASISGDIDHVSVCFQPCTSVPSSAPSRSTRCALWTY